MTSPPLEALPPFRTAHALHSAQNACFYTEGLCVDSCVHLGKCRSPGVADGLDPTHRLPSTEMLVSSGTGLPPRLKLLG